MERLVATALAPLLLLLLVVGADAAREWRDGFADMAALSRCEREREREGARFHVHVLARSTRGAAARPALCWLDDLSHSSRPPPPPPLDAHTQPAAPPPPPPTPRPP